MSWQVTLIALTAIVCLSALARAALWARTHRLELELEHELEQRAESGIEEQLGVLQRDVDFLMGQATSETAH